jgi:HK97 family phage major capsid protein
MSTEYLSEIKHCIDDLNTAFSAYKSTNDLRIRAIEKNNQPLAAELEQKLSRIEADVQTADKTRAMYERLEDRLNDLEMKASRPPRTGLPFSSRDEHTEQLVNWIRKRCYAPAIEARLQELEQKDITEISQPGGGYMLPKLILDQMEQFELKYSPVRNLVNVVQATSADIHMILSLGGASSAWSNELAARTATITPQFRDIAPTGGELYSYPQLSSWAVEDLKFDIVTYLSQWLAQEFSFQTGTAVISGSGTNRPTGMINTTPVTTNDAVSPLRAAAAYQYTGSVASPFAVTYDSLIDVCFLVNSIYRSNGTYVFNSTTAGAIRKIKDTTNQPIFQPSMQAGQPSTLNGYPIQIWEQMQDVGASQFPVAFGDFKRGYLLADVGTPRMIRDEVTNPGFLRLYVKRRIYGIPANNDAVKFIRTS